MQKSTFKKGISLPWAMFDNKLFVISDRDLYDRANRYIYLKYFNPTHRGSFMSLFLNCCKLYLL